MFHTVYSYGLLFHGSTADVFVPHKKKIEIKIAEKAVTFNAFVFDEFLFDRVLANLHRECWIIFLALSIQRELALGRSDFLL